MLLKMRQTLACQISKPKLTVLFAFPVNAAIQRALASPEVQQQFERASIDPINLKTQELASYLKADYERWGSVIRMGNIQPE